MSKKESYNRVRITEAMARKTASTGIRMTRTQLAKELWPNARVTTALTTLANYDNGTIKRVDISILFKLAKMLNVDFNFLLDYNNLYR